MDPITLQLLLASLPAVYQVGAGMSQLSQADKVTQRDTTPPLVKQATALAKQQAYATAPGQAQAYNDLAQSTANSAERAQRAATTSGGMLGLLSAIDNNEKAGLNRLASQQEAYHAQGLNHLEGALAREGTYQDQARRDADREKAALTQGGNENIFGGLSNGASLGIHALSGYDAKGVSPETIAEVNPVPGILNSSAIDPNLVAEADLDPLATTTAAATPADDQGWLMRQMTNMRGRYRQVNDPLTQYIR